MANKERKKRSARQARQAEREAQAAQLAADKNASAAKPAKVEKSQKPKAANKKAKRGVFSRVGNYFSTVRSEMHRVVWPNRTEMTNYSIGVILMLIFFGVLIWLVDTGVVASLIAYTGLKG